MSDYISAIGGTLRDVRDIQIVVFAPTVANATGDGKAYFHVPASMDGFILTGVHAEVITAGTTNTLDIQLHNVDNNLDMLSTLLTVDTGETGSDTAASAAAIDVDKDHINTNDVVRVDVDAVHSTPANGLLLTMTFERS